MERTFTFDEVLMVLSKTALRMRNYIKDGELDNLDIQEAVEYFKGEVESITLLEKAEWKIFTIWECELLPEKRDNTLKQLSQQLNKLKVITDNE